MDHVICSLIRLKGLKFSNTGYIMYSPDMTPFTNKMTVCSWLRDQSSSSYPTVFNYGPVNRVRFAATGLYNCIAEQCHLDVRSRLAAQVTKGDWFHACISWSTSSRSLRYYANGKLLGTMTTDSRTLSTGYKVVIGNHANRLNSQFSFIGEMRNLNVYSKELTPEEIRRQAEAGMCSLNQDENEDVRVLKWEDLIKLPKTGSVTELPISQQCSEGIVALVSELNRTTIQLGETQRTLENTRVQLSTTLEEKERISETLQETQENLKTTLEEKDRISETLQITQENLNTTLEEEDRISETLQETQDNLSTTLEEKERLSETLQETQENLNTTLKEKDRLSETLQETQENLNTTLEEKERLAERLQETQENLNTTLEEKERLAERLQETQENLNTTLEEKERLAERLQETQENLNTTLEEKERLAERLQETQENLNTTLEEKERLAERLQETQENLNTTLEEKERSSDTLQKTQANLNSTQLKLEKVSSHLTETMAELQVALDQIQNCNKTRWDWELFSQSEYFNKTISEEVAEQLSSSWDDIAGY